MLSYAKMTSEYFEKPYRPKISLTNTIIGQKYTVFKEIGEGRHSKIYLCMNKLDKKEYVIKFYSLVFIEDEDEQNRVKNMVYKRVNFLRSINNDNIIKCFQLYGGDEYLALVLEYCYDGTLEKYQEKRNLIPQDGIYILKQVISGIHSIHTFGYLVNCILAKHLLVINGIIKIANFQFLEENCKYDSIKAAPQLINKQLANIYNIDYKSTDVWTISMLYLNIIISNPQKLSKYINNYNRMDKSDYPTLFTKQLENDQELRDLNSHQKQFLKDGLKYYTEQRLSWYQLLSLKVFMSSSMTKTHQNSTFFWNYEQISCEKMNLQEKKVSASYNTNISNMEQSNQQLQQKIPKMQAFSYVVLNRSDITIQCEDKDEDSKSLPKQLDSIYFQVEKSEYIMNNILFPIENKKALDLYLRSNAQFMFLITSRCFIDLSLAKRQYEKHIKSSNSIFMSQLKKIIFSFKIIQQKFKLYSNKVTEIQSKISQMIYDRITNLLKKKQKQMQKDKFLTGIQGLDYCRQQQILFTQNFLIKFIIPRLQEIPEKYYDDINAKNIVANLKLYQRICRLKQQQVDNRKLASYIQVLIEEQCT